MRTFFKAQIENLSKGNWISEMKKVILELNIVISIQVKNIKKSQHEKIVSEKVKSEAFQYLKKKIKSKGSSIDYGDR